jgi:DNA-binding Lrp family transcriptional regulator
LDHGGRSSCSQLAKKLRRGRDTVEYRLDRLVDRGIVRGFRAVINPYMLGLTLHKTYLRLANDKARIRRFVERLKKEPRVFWIAACDGQWDLIVSIAASSAYEFHTIQGRLLSEIADILIASHVYVVVTFRAYRLKYLFESGTHWFEIGGRPERRVLDPVESSLIGLLSKNGRAPISELARELSTSHAVIQNRIERLEKDKVIIGYQADIDLEVLGITQFKTQLFLNDYNSEEEEKLQAYCNQHPAITCYIWQIGDCRSELEMHVESYAQYNEIIDNLRERFPRLIRNTTSLLMHTDYLKWMVLP